MHFIGERHSYTLYFEAEGYAAQQSKPLSLFGPEPSAGDAITQTLVELASGVAVTIARGSVQELGLHLRRPGERRLRFMDDDHKAVPGVGVRTFMFWSNASHCGYPWRSALLGEGISDSQGRVSVPDGDFRYYLELDKPYYQLQAFSGMTSPGEGGAVVPMGLLTYLSKEETVVELHRLRSQSLEMLVQRNGQPAVNQDLCADSFAVLCNFYDYCEPVATTDANGHIFVEEFYPEQWQHIFFLGDTGLLWAADVEDLAIAGLIAVELP